MSDKTVTELEITASLSDGGSTVGAVWKAGNEICRHTVPLSDKPTPTDVAKALRELADFLDRSAPGSEKKLPKEMTREELAALPIRSPSEEGFEDEGPSGEDIVDFVDDEGVVWLLSEGRNGWYRHLP
jgi:hypothetical protein